MRTRRRQVLLSAGLLIFLAFSLFVFAAVRTIPREITFLSGETGRIRVAFPLRLFAPEEARPFLIGRMRSTSELVFKGAAAGVFSVELKLLGALPVGRVAVKIVAQKEVMAGGHAIGVLKTRTVQHVL